MKEGLEIRRNNVPPDPEKMFLARDIAYLLALTDEEEGKEKNNKGAGAKIIPLSH